MIRPAAILSICLLSCACQSGPAQPQDTSITQSTSEGTSAVVHHWGGMRDVLRNGNTQGRVALADVVGPNTIAVGALEGLGAEITILNGDVLLAEVTDSEASDGIHVRGPNADESATLLVLANVSQWSEHTLGPVPDIANLEAAVRKEALVQGLDVTKPFPFRIEGVAAELSIHVLDHSCPIAHPEGPAPWRFTGTQEPTILVGFYAQDAAGTLTHHGQRSHIHAVLQTQKVSGHLDAVHLNQASRLFLPLH